MLPADPIQVGWFGQSAPGAGHHPNHGGRGRRHGRRRVAWPRHHPAVPARQCQ